MNYLFDYLLCVNVILFVTMGVDKRRAIQNRWRVRESTLFLLAILGGSLGGILGMRVFHHKTLHKTFRYGFPAILFIQCVLLAAIFMFFHP